MPCTVASLHDFWRGRIRALLNAGDVDEAGRIADRILDERFPNRWKG